MIVNLKSNIYATRNFSKTSEGTLSIEGTINCNGDLTVQGGVNELTKKEIKASYAISCKGIVSLANGQSNNDIYYKTSLFKGITTTTTSSTVNDLGVGIKEFTVETGLDYTPNSPVVITNSDFEMIGCVVNYQADQLKVDIIESNGKASDTADDWTIKSPIIENPITSLTSNHMGIGIKIFTVPTGLDYSVNKPVIVFHSNIEMIGVVVDYQIDQLTINITSSNGDETDIFSNWTIKPVNSWDSNQYQEIRFNSLPGFQEEYDLIGYLNYLLTIAETCTIPGKTFAGGIYNLKGYRTKSINVYDLIASNLSSTVEIKIGPNQGSTHLMKVDSPASPVVISNLVMNTTGVKPSPEDLIFAIDAPSISISNSTLFGTIYAPNSIVTITDSEIQGSIVAKDVIVVGTGSTTIKNKLFLGYIESPVAPEIKMSPLSSIDNYTELDVSVYSEDPIPDYYEIRYTLDGTIPTRSSALYVGNITVYVLGVVNVKAKIFGNGVEDGNVASQAYGFKCKTENPSLVKDALTGRYSISYPAGAKVYYTLDGSDPTVYSTLYEQPAFESIFDEEGSYYIRFIAILKGCDPSDMVDETIIVELPDGGVYPPRVTILKKNSSNVYVPIYTIDPTPNTELNHNLNKPKTYVFGKKVSGEAPDPNVIELLTSKEFTIDDVMNMKFSMSPYTAGDAIRYSMNEGNPVSGINYTGDDQINISSLSSNRLRAFSHVNWKEYSQQIDYTILFRTIDSKQFDTTENELKSEEVLASLQGGSSYAIDIAWVGPGVVTDDFAVYQALINILATDMLERIFNPTFGVSISAKLAEVHKISSGEKVIADLKAEVEAQDARIKIKEELSYAYFDDELGALVVDLVWVNTLTKNSAALKYAYDLDTIR